MTTLEEKKAEIMRLAKEYYEEKLNKKWDKNSDWIPYSGPTFEQEEYVAMFESLMEGWICFGEKANLFERQFPAHLGKKLGIFTNSGSSANLLMIAAAKSKNLYNLPVGSKIITPVACFPTTLNPLLQLGLTPIFVDVDIPSLNLNLDQVESCLQKDPSIRGIIFAHALGNPPNMDRIMSLVLKYNLILFEDTCDALGSKYDNKKLGSFGHLSSCSFYPAHHITTGEGGFVATDDSKAKKVLTSLRDWGRACYCNSTKPGNTVSGTACKNRFKNWLPGLPNAIVDHRYVFSEIGFNLKPLELQGAAGLVQMNKAEDLHNHRRANFNKLYKIFEKYEEYFHLPKATEKSDPSWFAFPLTIKDGCLFSKDDFVRFLEKNRIQTRSYFSGNILAHSGYTDVPNHGPFKEFPVANKIATDTFFLGTYSGIDDAKIEYIKDVVENFFKEVNTKS